MMRPVTLCLLPLILAAGALGVVDEECDAATPELCTARGESNIQRAQVAQWHQAELEVAQLQQAQDEGPSDKKAIPIAAGEGLGFLNVLITHVWPKVAKIVQEMVHHRFETAINGDLPPLLQTLKAFELSIGEKPPSFGPVRSYKTPHGGTMLKIGFQWDADVHFEVGWDYLKAGVQNLRMAGEVTVRLEQIMLEPPFFGGVIAYFVKCPTIAPGFTSALEGLDVFFVNVMRLAFTELAVLPNYIPVPLAGDNKGVDRSMIRSMAPLGIMRLTVLEAKLDESQATLLTGDESGLFVKCLLGDHQWTSTPVSNSLPKWGSNNVADLPVVDREQSAQIQLFGVGADQEMQLGKLTFEVGDIKDTAATFERALTGDDGSKVGSVRFQAEWFGTDVDGAGDCDKSFVVVKVFGIDTPEPLEPTTEMVVRAEIPGITPQKTPTEGPLALMHKAIQKISAKSGATFEDVVIDRALFFIVSLGTLADEDKHVSLTLEDQLGQGISKEPVKLNLVDMLSKTGSDRSLGGDYTFQTAKGPATASIRAEAWGLKRNL